MAERIRLAGYVVVPGGFSPSDTADLGPAARSRDGQQVAEFGADRLTAIGDSLTARCPLVYDEAFVRLAAHADVLALARELLGDYIVLMQQNGVINPAGQRIRSCRITATCRISTSRRADRWRSCLFGFDCFGRIP